MNETQILSRAVALFTSTYRCLPIPKHFSPSPDAASQSPLSRTVTDRGNVEATAICRVPVTVVTVGHRVKRIAGACLLWKHAGLLTQGYSHQDGAACHMPRESTAMIEMMATLYSRDVHSCAMTHCIVITEHYRDKT
jgi:hypothetical protein